MKWFFRSHFLETDCQVRTELIVEVVAGVVCSYQAAARSIVIEFSPVLSQVVIEFAYSELTFSPLAPPALFPGGVFLPVNSRHL